MSGRGARGVEGEEGRSGSAPWGVVRAWQPPRDGREAFGSPSPAVSPNPVSLRAVKFHLSRLWGLLGDGRAFESSGCP